MSTSPYASLPVRFLFIEIFHFSHPWDYCFRRLPICSFTFSQSNKWYVSFLYSLPLIALLTSLHTHTTFRLPPSSYVEFLLFFTRYISFFLYNCILTSSTCTLQLAFVLLQLHLNANFHALFLVSKFCLLPFDSLSFTFPFLAPPVDSGSDSESSSHLQLNGTSF